MKPIYEPKGKAKEYGDYALNIYTGCPHRCYYSTWEEVWNRPCVCLEDYQWTKTETAQT